MKILVADDNYTRGGAERIVWAVNTYTNHEARGLFKKCDPSRYAGTMPVPSAWCIYDPDEVNEAVEWCDVIHAIHSASPHMFGRPDVIGEKPIVWHMFTQWGPERETPKWYRQLWRKADMAHVKRALVAEGWHRYSLWDGEIFTLLPAIFPVDVIEFKPVPVSERRRVVSFGAMYGGDAPPAPKGFVVTKEVLKQFESDLMYRIPYLNCMRRKAKSWVGIDEIVTPVVHFTTFEYLSMGVPVISNHDELTVDAVKQVTGCDVFPVLFANEKTLRSVVEDVLKIEPDEMEGVSKDLRDWMVRFMHPSKTILHYVDLWKSL